jgi:hypothetical protein
MDIKRKDGSYLLMSKKASDLIVEYAEKTGNRSVLSVYFALCYHANKDRICYPGYARLKKISGIRSDATISKSLKILNHLGLVVIEKHSGKVNRYFLKEEMDPFLDEEFILQPLKPTPSINKNRFFNQQRQRGSLSEDKEINMKKEERRYTQQGEKWGGDFRKWIKTITEVVNELKGKAIVPYEQWILEKFLHQYPGEKVLDMIEETYLRNPELFQRRGLTLLEVPR